jgi:hypothetical protein
MRPIAGPTHRAGELAVETRKIRPDIPIVLMRGDVTPALLARAREAAEVLVRPLAAGEVACGLARALRD